MSRPELAALRAKTLAGLKEPVVEIGFGTGTNLPFYPKHIQRLFAIDSNLGMSKLAQRRIKSSGIEVEYSFLNVEVIPFIDKSYSSVVSTFTLCSIEHPENALKETYRILKPGGKLFFLEHGLNRNEKIQKWQSRLNPLNKIVAVGCNLNRNIRKIIEDAGFCIEHIEEFCLEKIPKTHGSMYQGIASKD